MGLEQSKGAETMDLHELSWIEQEKQSVPSLFIGALCILMCYNPFSDIYHRR